MIRKYETEREGQNDFYADYLKRVDSSITAEQLLEDNSDGVLKGNLLEFKLTITDLNSTLFQAIKYLSARRIKGKPVPANILLISLNSGTAYHYLSEHYLEHIEQVYAGCASKNNGGFIGGHPESILKYADNQLDESKLISLLRENNFIKIHIDENCIVGWATAYYKQNPLARKADFLGDLTGKVKIIGEIRAPDKFKDYIYRYDGATNAKFQYLMDKLNDELQKKNLGAFYTPLPYAEKSLELVRQAIKRVPAGNDYIILDRSAGTGNLELKMTDEEKSHTILSTAEYYEYKVLIEVLGDKVRHIIPPTEKDDTFNMGLVKGADALSKEYIENPVIKRYINDPECTVILFENPPYAETTSAEHQKRKASEKSSDWKKSYVLSEMRKEIKGSTLNDLGNAFIWSAFKYYLRQPTDSYIVYSPAKYWKAQHLINKKFLNGFAFNRKHFHTNTDACIMVALWANEESETDELTVSAYDIADNKLQSEGNLKIKRIHSIFSKVYYDKRTFAATDKKGILIGLNGLEKNDGKLRNTPVTSERVLGYLVANTSGFDNPDLNSSLLIGGRYDGNGFYLQKDNYLEKLPMFAASRYITYNRKWTERARIMKSADGAEKFYRDINNGKLSQFLLKCLMFTIFEPQNHMRTFYGSDNHFYRNELCLDTTNGETVASRDIRRLNTNEAEKNLLKQWNLILDNAKKTKNYNKHLTYGIYQIITELDTFTKNEETGEIEHDYEELHSDLNTIKKLVHEYYNTEIVPTLFEYEFLK